MIAVGDPLDGSTVTGLSLYANALNNAGQIAFSATLADGRSACLRPWFPSQYRSPGFHRLWHDLVLEEAGFYSARPLMHRTFAIFPLVAAAVFSASLASADPITMAWSPVGNAGNAVDPLTGLGSVPYNYNIGTYDVTNNQYSSFSTPKIPQVPIRSGCTTVT